ncbi:hypothetical protein B0T24DRAFT_594348 [Lasiosphaeria ovina]|uniref:Uncharacterized protein n=1 Tax=Lasiosphaeria ovina TaxID=92902 RepID=A0AAE0KE28_9PEZI|nr:hypothetical protein B0T24DRAFT_594348 [Lasiosphaeria ovina]
MTIPAIRLKGNYGGQKSSGQLYTGDTFCIDKTSSAELSEAINSMYRWYNKSDVCYAVLKDLLTDRESTTLANLEICRWFTRAWTTLRRDPRGEVRSDMDVFAGFNCRLDEQDVFEETLDSSQAGIRRRITIV